MASTVRKAELEQRLARCESKYLAADAAACQANEILACAQEKLAKGDEGAAFVLMDAAAVIVKRYAEEL